MNVVASRRISVIGAGYVGLVTAGCLSDLGHDVICVDNDPRKIDLLKSGEVPIFEPGLSDLIACNAKAGRLHFSLDLGPSVSERDAVFIAVGTPSGIKTGNADLRYVHSAAVEAARFISDQTVVVIKSTVPVGSSRHIFQLIKQNASAMRRFSIACNPEFLREGSAIEDFRNPERIVVGAEDDHAFQLLQSIYRPIWSNGARFCATGLETAEMIKYASNAFLAVRLSYINEISDLCEAVGSDVTEVAEGMGLDTRIGPRFLNAGPGWGGSCFPKDTLALLEVARDRRIDLSLVEAAVQSNRRRKAAMVDRIVMAVGGAVRGKRIAILGVTFKSQTDDMRESPSLDIVPALQRKGATITAHDPSRPTQAQRLLSDVTWYDDPYDALKGADAAVILTEWKALGSLDLARVARELGSPILIDLRNLYTPQRAAAAGLFYSSLGRRTVPPKPIDTTRETVPDFQRMVALQT